MHNRGVARQETPHKCPLLTFRTCQPRAECVHQLGGKASVKLGHQVGCEEGVKGVRSLRRDAASQPHNQRDISSLAALVRTSQAGACCLDDVGGQAWAEVLHQLGCELGGGDGSVENRRRAAECCANVAQASNAMLAERTRQRRAHVADDGVGHGCTERRHELMGD